MDRTQYNITGVKMKHIRILLIFLLFLFVVPASAVTASYTIYYKNATGVFFETVNATKGQVLYFNASAGGATTWAWDFGDGFYATGQYATHTYTFGKSRSLMLRDGWTTVGITLNASDAGSSAFASKTINLTTAMADLNFVSPAATIAALNESYANTFIAAIGGNTTAPADWIGIDFLGGLLGVQNVYVSVLGMSLFLILVFVLPFIMMWITSKDFVVPGIIGGFLGIWIIVRLPASMRLLAIVFIAMSIVAIIYSLLKEKM
jgi:hypothetical protein